MIQLLRHQFLSDPSALISKLCIKDKDGAWASLENLWPEQLTIINHILVGDSLVILKARQIGSTTACLAVLFLIWFLSEQPIKIMILAQAEDETKGLLERFYSMYESLPEIWKQLRPLDRDNQSTKRLADSRAEIKARTARTKGKGIRSDGYQYLLLSEFAFMDAPDKLLSAVLPALNNGQLIIESTASHKGDALEQQYLAAIEKRTSLVPLFFPWTCKQEYALPVDGQFVLTPDEHLMGLSCEQAAWRRITLASYTDPTEFPKNYPLTYEDAYAQRHGHYVAAKHLDYLPHLPITPDCVNYFETVDPTTKYTIGVDVGWGVGQNDSVVHVLNTRLMSIAACYRSNTVTFANLADIIARLSIKYNGALINCESNSKGEAVSQQLIAARANLLYLNEKLWTTSTGTKPVLVDTVRNTLTKGLLTNIDKPTYYEIRNATINNAGRLVTDITNKQAHGDGIISLGLALVAMDYISDDTVHHSKSPIARLKALHSRSQRRY